MWCYSAVNKNDNSGLAGKLLPAPTLGDRQMKKIVVTMSAIAGVLIGMLAPVNAGPQETTAPWDDTSMRCRYQ